MNYTIKINCQGGRSNHIGNPLVKLDDRTFDTREDACEAIYDAIYDVIDSERGCEMIDLTDYTKPDRGMLFVCDSQGNNCEPVNAEDDPYTLENADNCEVGDGDGSVALRRATISDDCGALVSHVAENLDGEIVGWYRFRELTDYGDPREDYVSSCHAYIMREGYAREDGVSATVEEVK